MMIDGLVVDGSTAWVVAAGVVAGLVSWLVVLDEPGLGLVWRKLVWSTLGRGAGESTGLARGFFVPTPAARGLAAAWVASSTLLVPTWVRLASQLLVQPLVQPLGLAAGLVRLAVGPARAVWE